MKVLVTLVGAVCAGISQSQRDTVEEMKRTIEAGDLDKLMQVGVEQGEALKFFDDEINLDGIDEMQVDEQNNISKVDFIKIDVEGSEYRVLNGGTKTIEGLKSIILYEYCTTIDKLSKSENMIKSFNLLQKLGYI